MIDVNFFFFGIRFWVGLVGNGINAHTGKKTIQPLGLFEASAGKNCDGVFFAVDGRNQIPVASRDFVDNPVIALGEDSEIDGFQVASHNMEVCL